MVVGQLIEESAALDAADVWIVGGDYQGML